MSLAVRCIENEKREKRELSKEKADMEATKVSISCPNCGARYRIPDSVSAKKVNCKKCGSAIFLRLQGAFREKNGSNGSGPRRPRPTTSRYARLKGPKQVKMGALHYVSAVLTIVLLVAFVKVVFF
jgi:predicted Zn finger-like uncharacterized protein